ncbi:MAG TPA: bacillithiol biosynthesis deacetylase BshB1 [Holophaga sp.]|nr:bacillithiol biosynthesis deacetylase BshB1 [Holophaga sp.]HPS66995.1 bacillithiol biosynthesis deacetylase BshB1 [Holophaga sp.]
MTARIDLLVMGAHPDDAEVHVGGILAKAVKRGMKAAILDLTMGDLGTRGTPEIRRQEAAEAARILGVDRIILDLPDARFGEGTRERDRIVDVLRNLRPSLVILPGPEDQHPDHRRAFRLGREAAYCAGIGKYPSGGERWRPEAVAWAGGVNPATAPDLVVDVSEVWPVRMEAFDAFGSQFAHDPSQPATRIAHPSFRRGIEGRAMHWGSLIQAEYAEGLWCEKPIPPALLRWAAALA